MGLTIDEQVDWLSYLMEYKGYHALYDCFCNNTEIVHKYEDFKWNGVKDCICSNTVQKVKSFIQWMYLKKNIPVLHDHFLFSLTNEDYIKFKGMDIEPMPNIRSYHAEPTKPMTTFYGHTKPTTISESQTALNNFRRGTKRDASAYPIFKNDLYYDPFQRSFVAVIKAQGLYDVVDPDYDPDDGDQYEKELFQEKQHFVYSVMVTSLQTERGRELVKEFGGDARSIISELQHYHTKSNVAQHEIVTLTIYITNLSLSDSWKGTIKNAGCLTALSLILISFQTM